MIIQNARRSALLQLRGQMARRREKSLTCPDVLDGSLQAAVIWQTLVWTQKEISTDQMTKAGSVNVFTR